MLDKPYVPISLGGPATSLELFHQGWPMQAPEEAEIQYYELQLGFAIQTTIVHFIEPKRRDFQEMLIHHTLLLCLVVFSWLNGWFRIGMCTFIIHDVSDTFLYLLKISSSFDNTIFVIFSLILWIVTWTHLRLYAFPTEIIWTIIQHTNDYFIDATIFINFLSGLFCLHIFWTYMIFRAIWNMANKGIIEDSVAGDKKKA